MNSSYRIVAMLALGAAAAPWAAARAQASVASPVWVAGPTVKVRPDLAPPSGAAQEAVLAGARNEFVSFQVVVRGGADDVSMSLSGLTHEGAAIAGRDVVLYREALIDVSAPSGGDGGAGTWPDALIPDIDPFAGERRNAFPFSVPPDESRAVLVDIHIPDGAPAGLYTGQVEISGGITASVPVRLVVWDFGIPSTASLRSAFGLIWNGPCLGHGDASCSDLGAESALRNRYVQAALDNRFSLDSPELGAPVAEDGSTNWSDFDANIGPFLDGTAPTRLAGARLTAVQTLIPSGASATTEAAAAWGDHFRQRGWFDVLYNMPCDEPPITCAFEDINPRIAAAQAGDPGIPNLVTTSIQRGIENGLQGVDLYAPIVNWIEDKAEGFYPGPQRDQYGPTVWWYQSCLSHGCARPEDDYGRDYFSGWPTLSIDVDGSRYRAQEWLSFVYGISGMYYFETMYATSQGTDPWSNQDYFGGWGDGTLFYPGTTDRIGGQTEIPIESLRMKGIRDGEQDYELLLLAAARGHGAEAAQIARSVFPRTFESNGASPQAIEAARGLLAQLIQR